AGGPPERQAILAGLAYRDIPPGEALTLYQEDPTLVVLDVRTREEHAAGHILRARLVPLDELEHRLGELPPPDTPVLVQCTGGARAAAACERLRGNGYSRLVTLSGGLPAWSGPGTQDGASVPAGGAPAAKPTAITFAGGPVSEAAIVEAIRECFDPEVPVNIY